MFGLHNLVHFYHDCFDWPNGVVIGNLLASMLWVPVQWFGIHVRLAAHHAEVHKHLDDQDEFILKKFDDQDALILDKFAAQDAVLAEIRDLLHRPGPGLLPDDESL